MSIDYLSIAVSGVQKLAPYAPGKAIEELERETGVPVNKIIKLASNESPLKANPHVIAAIHDELKGLTCYPDSNGFRLKKKLSKRFGLNINGITLGNGSNDLLIMIAQAFLSCGCNAVFSQYAFSVYDSATRATGAEAREIPALDWAMTWTACFSPLMRIRALYSSPTQTIPLERGSTVIPLNHFWHACLLKRSSC